MFFVISGFLITSLLLRELDRTGRISLTGFWARRARRILPAALVVLLACTIATQALVPKLHWEQFMAEIRWSALYAENWQLANTAVDYFAQGDGPAARAALLVARRRGAVLPRVAPADPAGGRRCTDA